MEKSFLSRIKILFSGDESYQISRRFAAGMLPLSFLAGIFICAAVPSSYYYLERIDALKYAELYAVDIASSFREVLETNPLNWEDELHEKLIASSIGCVEIADRDWNLVAQLASCDTYQPSLLPVMAERYVSSVTGIYAVVRVSMAMAPIEKHALILLLTSLLSGTFVGVALFLHPVFKVQDVEDEVTNSYQKLHNEQQKLKISEEQFKTFFESSPDGIAIATEDGVILSANLSFREMFQLRMEDIRKIKAYELYDRPPERDALLATLFEVGMVRNEEIVFNKKDGTKMSALISMNLIRKGVMGEDDALKQETVLILAVIKDISDKKAVEKQLVQAQKMESIGMLAGGVAHDFNNLLTGVMGYANLIEIETPGETTVNGYAQVIKKTAARGSELTGKLLAFARGGKYQPEEMDVNATVEEVLSILKHTIDKKIAIVRELAQDLHAVKADAGQLNQVLLNLCVNARDSMAAAESCTLTVRTYNIRLDEKHFVTGDISIPGEYTVVSVADTGTGIDQALLSKIFDPFFSTKKQGEGTGLGLSMVYGIVKSHNGYIDIVSEPGNGSSFDVYLPSLCHRHDRGDIVSVAETCLNPEELRGGSETILLIEDEELIRNFCSTLLKQTGYNVLQAEDGVSAVSLYGELREDIDLVLLDMILPNKNGPEVFYELMAMNPDVKVILVSGYCIDSRSEQLLKDGAITFVQKPYEIEKLLDVIRATLFTA